MGGSGVRRARAFAPGHLTGIFVPDRTARDPRAQGSVGAGVVLAAGAYADATWDPGGESGLDVGGAPDERLPITAEALRHLPADGRGRLTVRVTHELPVGQGFSMSAAGTLAASLAAASALGVSRSRAVECAHLAELFGGGGLGGVAAILGGGLERRTRPGIPPWGHVVHRNTPQALHVGWVGPPRPSPRLLRDPAFLARVKVAGARSLGRLGDRPDWNAFLEESERFTDALGLASRRLARLLRGLRRLGVPAAQGMFGESFFAYAPTARARARLERHLRDLGLEWQYLHVAQAGARVISSSPRSRPRRAAAQPF